MFACNNSTTNQSTTATETNQNVQPKVEKHFSLEINKLDTESYEKIGDKFELKIQKDGEQKIDSSIIKIDGKKFASLGENELIFTLDTKNFRCGLVPISIEINYDGKKEYVANSIKLASNITPKKKSYKIEKVFNHDKNAYTQGLFFENGVLYESTGLNRKSSLRKVKLENGDVMKAVNLESQYFGEGITTIGNKIYMLTWRSQKGFVYDKETFQQLSEFQLNSEGWGLTNVGDTLLLTDGTENIYFLDKEYCGQLKYVQVYDNLGPVKMLNESEIINGHLYANIYQSDLIAEIDYHTGKVLSYIDLSGILPENLIDENTDVLNGIAYDEKGNRIFVTGKNWPKLYQIKIIDK